MRRLVTIIWLAALAVWIGILVLMNLRLPDATGQAIFLLLFGLTVTLTTIPLLLAIRPSRRTESSTLARFRAALTRALLFGLLAIALMTLHLLRLFNLTTALLLGGVTLLLQLLISLRSRA
ncbi:MAG: hypothetical protein GXY52_03260 [Chloroflexi bacterium]|nr:hypothetical protein [Chloroflexota bacterium]